MVDTSQVTDRRDVRFERLEDILADAEMLDRAGAIRTSGNWTAAQNVHHVARSMHDALDGYAMRAPALTRAKAALRRGAMLRGGLPAGLKLPETMQHFLPPSDVTWPDALASLRRAVGRAAEERMEADHPILGRMSPAQWVQFHCRHAELHFGFLHPSGG